MSFSIKLEINFHHNPQQNYYSSLTTKLSLELKYSAGLALKIIDERMYIHTDIRFLASITSWLFIAKT